jgi:hypothetical protein
MTTTFHTAPGKLARCRTTPSAPGAVQWRARLLRYWGGLAFAMAMLGCPRDERIWVSVDSTSDSLEFVFGQHEESRRKTAIGFLTVVTCGDSVGADRNIMWDIGAVSAWTLYVRSNSFATV